MLFSLIYNLIVIILVALISYKAFLTGYALGNGKSVPTKVFEKPISKEQKKKLKRYETIMANIDAYDGTSNGQVDLKE